MATVQAVGFSLIADLRVQCWRYPDRRASFCPAAYDMRVSLAWGFGAWVGGTVAAWAGASVGAGNALEKLFNAHLVPF